MKIHKLLLFFCLYASALFAHCQVPCGIYDDDKAFKTLMEHAHTIERAVQNINDESTSLHQKVRWIQNKEKHATDIQDLVNHYFLIQRIKMKIPQKKSEQNKQGGRYSAQLMSAHAVLVAAMKSKQGHNLESVKSLKNSILTFQKIYIKSKKKSR